MNAIANRQRQQRQIVVLVVLLGALGVLVAFQVLPLLGGTPTPAPLPPRVVTAPAAAASGAGRPGTPARSGSGRASGAAANRTSGAAGAANGVGGVGGVEEVNLAKLKQPEPEPVEGHRNPFSMAPEPKPPSEASGGPGGGKGGGPLGATPPPITPVATGPPPVPPPPPITLKFFGVISAGGRVGKVAALGDGKFVYHGREGETIEGRYRIVKIGEESIQMEYVDGRGRQTIRLSGK